MFLAKCFSQFQSNDSVALSLSPQTVTLDLRSGGRLVLHTVELLAKEIICDMKTKESLFHLLVKTNKIVSTD